MTRYDHRTENLRDVSMYPLDVSGNGAANLKYRIQWTEPVFVSPHDSNVLYTAAQFVLKSDDQGRSWKRISGDLTRNDKSKQQPSGGPITLDITSVEYYDTVFALAESPLAERHALGRYRRWPDPTDARRWSDVAERHAEGHAAMEHGQHHRAFAA